MTNSELPIFVVAMLCVFVFCLILIIKPNWILNLYAGCLKWFSIEMKYTNKTMNLFRAIGVGVLILSFVGAYLTLR